MKFEDYSITMQLLGPVSGQRRVAFRQVIILRFSWAELSQPGDRLSQNQFIFVSILITFWS